MLWHSVNTQDSELKQAFLDGTLNVVRCPKCGNTTFVPIPVLYHDVEHKLLVNVYDGRLSSDPSLELDPKLLEITRSIGEEIVNVPRFEYARYAARCLEDPEPVELILRLRSVLPNKNHFASAFADLCHEAECQDGLRLQQMASPFAAYVFSVASAIAPGFRHALTVHSKIDPDVAVGRVIQELCALYIHLMDRDAFASMGPAMRSRFIEPLGKATAGEIALGSRSHEAKTTEDSFSSLLNKRQREFQMFQKLLPEHGNGPKGTLFWEFSKAVGFEYEGYNPAALSAFTVSTVDGYLALLSLSKHLRLFECCQDSCPELVHHLVGAHPAIGSPCRMCGQRFEHGNRLFLVPDGDIYLALHSTCCGSFLLSRGSPQPAS